jgi:hypothetical protein
MLYTNNHYYAINIATIPAAAIIAVAMGIACVQLFSTSSLSYLTC